ncbi:peptidyl-dipeptidase Dcp [Microbacterium sp. HM58-2]|nr:peptidyl-dipeptidase Dcp [Microbacterium sp. HM58-2]
MFENGELRVFTHSLLHAFHVRQRDLPEPQRHGAAQCEFPESHSETYLAVDASLQDSYKHHLIDDPMSRRARESSPPPDVTRRLRSPVDVERLKDADDAGEHRIAARRIGHAARMPQATIT